MSEYVKGFLPLPEHLKQVAYCAAWSIQNMDGHECAGLKTTYKGSVEKPQGYITDYFQDENGGWWFDERFKKKSGEIITIEQHIFGKKLPERKNREWKTRCRQSTE